MCDKNSSSIWSSLDFESVKRRIRQINKWFEPFLSNHELQSSLEHLKEPQTESSEFDTNSK